MQQVKNFDESFFSSLFLEDFEPETESFFYHETTLDGYEITIDMASQKDGVVEFRCKYENGKIK